MSVIPVLSEWKQEEYIIIKEFNISVGKLDTSLGYIRSCPIEGVEGRKK